MGKQTGESADEDALACCSCDPSSSSSSVDSSSSSLGSDDTHSVVVDLGTHCSAVVAVAAGGCSEVSSSVVNDFFLLGFRVLAILLKSLSLCALQRRFRRRWSYAELHDSVLVKQEEDQT